MTKVKIQAGVCGFTTIAEATAEDPDGGDMVIVKIYSGCKNIREMASALQERFNAYEECFCRPGSGSFYNYAKEHFSGHASCPAIAGIIKCIEAEAKLALPRDVHITFE